MQLKNAKLFINPAAGRGDGRKFSEKIYLYLKQNGLNPDVAFSSGKGELINLAKQAILEGYCTIIIAGGDGSIHEAVNGMMQARKILAESTWNELNPNLGIIPIGTGNDFIKAVGIPKNIEAACDYLLNAKPEAIDLGYLKTDDNQSAYFINNIGAGFDGKIGLDAQKIPIIRGIAVYALALTWNLIKGIPKPYAKLTIDNQRHEGDMTLVAISNGTTYGGTFNIAPDAKFDDGKLDCVFVPASSRISVIPMLLQLMRAKHLTNPKILFKQCKNFEIETNEPIVVIADGELVSKTCTQFKIKTLHKQFNLLLSDQ